MFELERIENGEHVIGASIGTISCGRFARGAEAAQGCAAASRARTALSVASGPETGVSGPPRSSPDVRGE
jgi:hypothetical protein